VLLLEYCNFLLQTLLSRAHSHHCPLLRFISGGVLAFDRKQLLSECVLIYRSCFWKCSWVKIAPSSSPRSLRKPYMLSCRTNERKLLCLKCRGKDFVCQTGDIFDHERTAVLTPADYVVVGGILSEREGTSMMRKVLARKMGIVLRISSRLRY